MPVSNKIRYVYQKILLHGKLDKKYPEKELKNTKLVIPYSKYKKAKIIIIHDIDNLGFENELSDMLELEKKHKTKSVCMLLPHTLNYSNKLKFEPGMHETFPYKFKKHFSSFKKKPRSFSQHVAIPATNFYPKILDALPKQIKYFFSDPVSFGYKRNHVLHYKPRKYKQLTLIAVVSEPNKKTIDKVLEKADKEKGIVAFNFHPDHLYVGDRMFSKSYENFLYLLKKLR